MSAGRRGTSAIVAMLILAACGSGASKASPTANPVPSASASTTASISALTKMICEPEAEGDIARTLGVKITRPLRPSWIDRNYSCRYVYAAGAMRLSVKQLPDTAATTRYVEDLAADLGRRAKLTGLGESAFTTSNGSVVVRKDDKVLVVDVHDLAPQFGNPPDTRANAAISVAATIMGCWTGA